MTCNKINNHTTKKSTKRKDKKKSMGARALVTGTACIMATNIGKVSKNPDDQKGAFSIHPSLSSSCFINISFSLEELHPPSLQEAKGEILEKTKKSKSKKAKKTKTVGIVAMVWIPKCIINISIKHFLVKPTPLNLYTELQ